MPKFLTFVSLESQKRKRTNTEQKILGKIMTKNFPNLAKDINTKIQEALVSP
jgi:hypothetical protein